MTTQKDQLIKRVEKIKNKAVTGKNDKSVEECFDDVLTEIRSFLKNKIIADKARAKRWDVIYDWLKVNPDYKLVKKEQAIYEKAIKKWGKSLQICMAIEEMAELTKELIKFFRGKANSFRINEEMADVELMLDQLKVMFKNETLVAKEKERKIKRLKGMLCRGK